MADSAQQANESILGRFMVLRGAMPELWITFLVKLIGIAAYAVMNSTLVLWLSKDLGFNDQNAGFLVAAWSISMTVFTLMVGSLTDALGLRRTFILGVLGCIAARGVMAVTTIPLLALLAGLLPLAIGEALGTPVLVAAIRRYSTTSQRSISFSIFYMMMNFGFLVSGFIFDGVRESMGEYGRLTLPLMTSGFSTYQTLFLASLGLELLLLPILYFGIRSGAEATEEGVRITPEGQAGPPGPLLEKTLGSIAATVRETGRNLAALGRHPGLYRLLGFLTLIAFTKQIYMKMY